MDTLKPCPFCGGEARLRAKHFTDGTCSYWVNCARCKAQVEPVTDVPEVAIKAWNTRAERTCNLKLFKGQNEYSDVLEGVCSKCSAFMDSQMRYCPNCGAKVVE